MRSISLLLWSLIVCYHVGFATSFQHHQRQQRRMVRIANSKAVFQVVTYWKADDHPHHPGSNKPMCHYHRHHTQYRSTCLFANTSSRTTTTATTQSSAYID